MRKLAATAALAGVALLTPALSAPAEAATVRINDQPGDAKAHDVKWVRVKYGPDRLKITMKWAAGSNPSDFQDVFVDTRKKDAGPEVEITGSAETEHWYAGFVKNWKMAGWKRTCTGKADYDLGDRILRMKVPRACIRRDGHAQPKRVRVSARDVFETERVWDWVPGKRQWSRWIHWK